MSRPMFLKLQVENQIRRIELLSGFSSYIIQAMITADKDSKLTVWDQERLLFEEFGHGEICEKNHLACEAIFVVQEAVMDLGEIQEEDALVFGPLTVAYCTEAILHNEDRISIEIEVARMLGLDYLGKEERYSPRTIHEARMKGERALLDACGGNYRGIKAILATDVTLVSGLPDESDHREAQRRFYKIVEVMPDFAEPFVLPNPAWMDFDFEH